MRTTSSEPTQQQTNKEDTDEQQQQGKQNLDDMIIYDYYDCQIIEKEQDVTNEEEGNDVGRGKYFPTYLFDEVQPEVVSSIPQDIDGKKYYLVKTTPAIWHEDTSDLHHFVMRTSTRQGFYGRRKIGFCHGSYVCKNPKCPFLSTSHEGQPNRINWKTQRGKKEKICQICDHFASEEGCGARKMVEYLPSEELVHVYHIGKHKCHMKIPFSSNREAVKRKAEGNTRRTGSAKRLALENIENLIGEGRINEATDEADTWVDTRFARRVLNEANTLELDIVGEDNNSFDALAIIKKQADLKDEFYVYCINNGTMNDSSDYVFKSSSIMAQLAV